MSRPVPLGAWWGQYTGIPYLDKGRDRAGCDCYGLARLVLLEQRGLELPSYSAAYESALAGVSISEAWAIHGQRWRETARPEPFAVALFELDSSRLHCGIVIDAQYMLHTAMGRDSCRQRLATLRNQFRGFFIPPA